MARSSDQTDTSGDRIDRRDLLRGAAALVAGGVALAPPGPALAQTEQQALAIREKAQAEGVTKVTQRGWTPEKFSSIGDAINSDPALTERAVKLIEAK